MVPDRRQKEVDCVDDLSLQITDFAMKGEAISGTKTTAFLIRMNFMKQAACGQQRQVEGQYLIGRINQIG